MPSSFTKTTNTTLLALQSVAASSVVVGSAVSIATKLGATALIRFGRRSATAAGASAILRLEGSSASGAANTWFPIVEIGTAFAACEAEALTGTVSSGQNVLTLASTTNLTAQDIIFIDNTTPANSEFGRIKSIVANTSVTIIDNLVNAQTGSTIYDAAEIYAPVMIPPEFTHVRLVADGSLFTQAFAVEAFLATVDSIG